jgi:MoaA/NifB/PqqE/SkfB family radical SAM enzyme
VSPVPLPRFLQIEPVGQCNLRCQMCPIQFRRDGPPHGPPAFLDFDVFTEILDRFGIVEELQLQGLGEPMMHPRFFDMVAHAAGRGIRVSTNSNLTLLNARRAEACVTSGLERLHVSVDGARAATYEAIRRGARLDRVKRNIERLLAVRERIGSARPQLSLVVVAMRQNLDELPELVRLAASWRMSEVFVQHLAHDFGEESLPAHYRPMRQWVDGQTLLWEDAERVIQRFSEARVAAAQAGVALRLPSIPPRPHPPGTPGRQRCDWPWRGAYLSYQGLAMPCCMVATPDRVNFGNMVEAGPDAVWNGPDYERFRARLESDTPPAICRTCSVYLGSF